MAIALMLVATSGAVQAGGDAGGRTTAVGPHRSVYPSGYGAGVPADGPTYGGYSDAPSTYGSHYAGSVCTGGAYARGDRAGVIRVP